MSNQYRLKLSRSLGLGKNPQQVLAICSKTGLPMTLEVVGLPSGLVFSYHHPLALYGEAVKILKLGNAALEKLDLQTLAALVLTTYKKWDLFFLPAEGSGLELNKILCTAGPERLIQALGLTKSFTAENTENLPRFSLNWETHKDWPSIGQPFGGWLAEIEDWIRPAERKDIPRYSESALKLLTTKGLKKSASMRTKLSEAEKDFEAWFKESKKELREMMLDRAFTSLIPAKMLAICKLLPADRNLIGLSSELRTKLCVRAEELYLATGNESFPKLIEILQNSDNPYDIFVKIDDGLEKASDLFSPKPFISLDHLIEQKKEKEALKERLALAEASESAEEPTDEDLTEAVEADIGPLDEMEGE